MIVEESAIRLTVDEALEMAKKLLEAALIVKARQAKMTTYYDTTTFLGTSYEGTFGKLFKVTVGGDV